MISKLEKIYVFEEFRLEPDKRGLFRVNGSVEQIRLSNRPFQVLLYLIENRERFVARDELLEKFWDGRDVYDTALTKAVGAVRKALGEPTESPRFIETRWAEGYRFIGNVVERPVYLEIERTREVKVVIEEESEPFAAESAVVHPQPPAAGKRRESHISNLKPETAERVFFTRGRVAAIFCLLLAGALFYAVTRSRPPARPTKTVLTNPAPVKSIAVLPLRNLSGNPERDIFVDGITESLINSLSKIKGLKVISRNSSFVYKDKNAAPREIAAQFGVATYLEGGFRESGDKIRVEVRLVNAENGEILWSGDSYERKLGDVFDVQDDIARRVTTQLRLKLSAAEQERFVKRQTSNVEAYQNYVKGRHFWKRKTPGDLEKARGYFENAIALDPQYTLALAGLADYYLTGVWYADFEPQAALKNAKAVVAKVLEINGHSPEAHILKANIAAKEWDWETCRRETERAIELNPNEASYWQAYAFVLRNLDGKYDEAVTAIKRAAELDPLSPSINTDVGVMLTHAGRLEEAVEAFKKTLETSPQFHDAYWNLGIACERLGLEREAAAAFIEHERLMGTGEERLNAFRRAFEQDGLRGFWQKRLEFFLNEKMKKNATDFYFAVNYSRAGDREAALEHLEKSYAAREPYLVNLKSDFSFDDLRGDSRFTDLMRRVGL